MAMSVVVGSFDADGWVTARSIDRVAAGESIDLVYLATLSEDGWAALPALARIDGQSPAARYLEATWSELARTHRESGWRSWRGLDARPPHLPDLPPGVVAKVWPSSYGFNDWSSLPSLRSGARRVDSR
jgi:hypothetical protein